jgi:polygalacturonase
MLHCSRREAFAILGAALLPTSKARAAEDPWDGMAAIRSRIRPPEFPNRDFEITRFGAKPNGVTDCTAALRQAIDEAARAGGGRVVIPQGVTMTGAVHLKSNVHIYVPKDATLRFIPDPKLYPIVPTRFEGLECMNYSPFVYAYNQQNIAITGGGTLDGQANCDHWWPWSGKSRCGGKPGDPDQRKARAALMEMAEKGVPVEQRVFGDGGYLRPMFVQPYRCSNVLIEGVTIVNSPMYEMHPVLCRNVTVRDVTVSSHGPNNDGCDPESSSDVLIEGCIFDTGDDCIAIKSGRNADGRRLHTASENIIIQNCTMKDGHGGVTLGSECTGGIRNVYAQDCRMDSPNLDRVLRFKDNAMRGGVIENIYMRNVQAGQVAGPAIEVDLMYEEGPNGPYKPLVRNVEVANLDLKKCRKALSLRGYRDAPIQNVVLRHCTFEHAAEPNAIENITGLVLDDVRVNGELIQAPRSA